MENKVYIFFDHNPPIATNTTFNTLVTTLHSLEVNGLENRQSTIRLFPTPTSGELQLESDLPLAEIILYNGVRSMVLSQQFNATSTFEQI